MKIKKSWIKLLIFAVALAAAVTIVYFFLPTILKALGFLIELALPAAGLVLPAPMQKVSEALFIQFSKIPNIEETRFLH